MKAREAIDRLRPERWANTRPAERLHLLEQVRENMKRLVDGLAASDTQMKNELMGEELYSNAASAMATVVPLANTVTACIELYESILHGEMPRPIEVTQVADDLYDIEVFPQTARDKVMYADRRDYLRVRGEPRQVNPLDKPAGIIAVLGAGNYSSSLETIKALFLENCAVVHKPHHLNERTDALWERILQPLVTAGALSFCEADQGRVLSQDDRVNRIYFTGSAETAEAIRSATDSELVAECGGNNPCIVVPGDRPWTEREIKHQAVQIATMAKLNGGAVCGRPQTLVTSRSWPQREDFLQAVSDAIEHDTPAAGTYYPGSKETARGFLENHPNARVLHPENGAYDNGVFMFIPGVGEDDYAVKHEAFCQILSEVPLDTPNNASEFLPRAVEFCNTKLLGTLGCCILMDEETTREHQGALDHAVTELRYGGIAVNTMPPFIFLNPYLTWGGNDAGPDIVSGNGNFGNLLGYENVEKSITHAAFMSPGHMLNTNKRTTDALMKNMTRYALNPSWMNLTRMMAGAVVGSFRRKDFEG